MRTRRIRRPRRKSMWLEGASGACSTPVPVGFCNPEVAPEPFLINLIENPIDSLPGQVGSAGEATVVRLVGELLLDALFVNTVPTQTFWSILTVYMGIYITDADDTGAVLGRSVQLDSESKDWMWIGTYTTSECGLPATLGPQNTLVCFQNDLAGAGTNANGSHIDITVKRKIRKEENIVLSIVAEQDDVLGSLHEGNWTLQVNGSIRGLILLP